MLARSVPSPLLSPSLLLRTNNAAPLLHPRSTRRRQRCLRISALSDPLDLLRSLATAIPSPAAALASAAATAALSFLLSQRPRRADPQARGDAEAVAGCWILYTSPTPFNRCVLLRCPSVSFEDGGGDRLLRRDRHYVNLCCGSIPVCSGSDPEDDGISYQRLCVGTEDGGVISLDWPDDLDLEKEHGLDTTVLVVPGTAEGSMDKNVKMFVADALNHGYFPIVMNPRGCAGSPLTTARLFTAADSDDVSTAIQYINRLRPWTTMMSVACGYGANMLTKYLAEVREATPLTAAVCIDNPFDLDEATRSFPHHEAMDQKLRSGLIDILQANKEIFQGKAKGFDVAKALSATSIRDFDGALSMISYGFDSIEDFYSNLSTRQSVSNVKIPLLYIQSDDGTVPLFSVPRSSISENPFTSLLLCSCLESTIIAPERSAIHWCQHLAIEWLSAVELALLKGRHPLLKDVEITIKPSEGLAKSFSSDNEDNYLKLARPNLVNGFLSNPSINVFRGNGPVIQSKASSHLEPGSESHCGQRRDVETEQETSSNMSEKCGMVNEVLANKGDSEIGSEQSQVLQTAAVVMNMLDVTMPGTLDDEQKRKVLTAVEQGETLMKALQGAVPEDVCGKLTTAVTEILQTQSANLNLDGFRRIGWIPNVAPNMKSRMRKLGDNNASDQRQSDAGSEGRPEDDSARSNAGSNNTQEGIGSSQQQATKAAEYVEPDSEMSGKPNDPKKIEKASGGNEEVVGEQVNADQSHGVAQRNPVDDQVIENDATKKEAKRFDSEAEPVLIPSSNSEKACAAASSDLDHPVEKDENLILKNEGQISQVAVDQKAQTSLPKSEEPSPPPSKAPPISVTQALDALTGFDDSTQIAMNSVFGVLENMIDQLEKANNQGKDDEVGRADNPESDIESRNSPISADKTEKICDSKSGISLEFNVTQSSNEGENSLYVEEAKCHEEVVASSGNRVSCGPTSPEKIIINYPQENNAEINDLTKGNINKVGYVQNFPVGVSLNPYWHSPYRTYFHGYFSTQLPVLKSMYSDSTTDLILDPKGGQWRMLDQAGHTEDIKGENGESQTINEKNISFSSRETDKDKIIEPSYIILDNEDLSDGYSTSEEQENLGDSSMIKNAEKELMYMIKDNILDALKVEVGRRLGLPKLEELETNLACDLEQVASSVSQAIVNDKLNSNLFLSEGSNSVAMKLGAVEGEHIIKAVYSAVQEASHLRKVLPVGVIVGSTLASLRKHFQVAASDDNDHFKAVLYHPQNTHKELNHQECDIKDNFHVDEKDQHGDSKKSFGGVAKPEKADNNSDGIMVGAVTAALGASALLAHHQQKINKCEEVMSNVKGFPHNEHVKIEEAVQEKNQNNLVSSLAEKAMSVAGPVVPTKGDGEVDHERLVAILAELGQKGGLLRLIGKIALLWGGIRGAMSLTDRLISFLRIAERPLFQRLFGFICMALVLWSPVVIPLLPTLVQSWTTKTSNGIAEYACIIGLYAAVLILVILWGKRIRGYDDPLEQYGLDTASIPRGWPLWPDLLLAHGQVESGFGLLSCPNSDGKVHHILKGLLGGVVIVLFTHSVNALLGFASLSWPLGLPSSSQGTMVLLKTYASALVLAVRGTMTALCIALVEELLFRSWFPEEVAVDLGYYRAIVVSGLAFALAQRSLQSVPGFLLLSLALFGIKQRAYGKLYAPIGVRMGIMTANFILQNYNFLKYRTDTPFWLASTHPWHPFDGVVGLSVCGILAVLFFPKQSLQNKKVSEDYLG